MESLIIFIAFRPAVNNNSSRIFHFSANEMLRKGKTMPKATVGNYLLPEKHTRQGLILIARWRHSATGESDEHF